MVSVALKETPDDVDPKGEADALVRGAAAELLFALLLVADEVAGSLDAEIIWAGLNNGSFPGTHDLKIQNSERENGRTTLPGCKKVVLVNRPAPFSTTIQYNTSH